MGVRQLNSSTYRSPTSTATSCVTPTRRGVNVLQLELVGPGLRVLQDHEGVGPGQRGPGRQPAGLKAAVDERGQGRLRDHLHIHLDILVRLGQFERRRARGTAWRVRHERIRGDDAAASRTASSSSGVRPRPMR